VVKRKGTDRVNHDRGRAGGGVVRQWPGGVALSGGECGYSEGLCRGGGGGVGGVA